MKKMFALLLALSMSLGLAACGGQKADTDEKVKIGFTYYEPMNYTNEKGEFVGFETEFATAVYKKLGMTPDFQEINWDSKVMELDSKNIDCIWNGMTKTAELDANITLTAPYLKNYQVVVIRAADAELYRSTADLENAKIDAEAGSTGEDAVMADASLSKASYTSVTKQVDALLEVKTGAADACVLDFVLANAMVGQGDYSDLAVIPDLQLSVEEYVVGFRKGDELAKKVDQAMVELAEDGTLAELAEKYDLADLLVK